MAYTGGDAGYVCRGLNRMFRTMATPSLQGPVVDTHQGNEVRPRLRSDLVQMWVGVEWVGWTGIEDVVQSYLF